ncbi:MAG: hypothetical protein NTZ49_04490 [Candidatus Parcubacteria bacterium]|nr:hypothetical protein [Candidatus Parcubacteria bacterium]
MKVSVLKGFSFGLTSGVITTLGLMVGLYATTHSKLVMIGGILSIAVADAFSDALGMHISVESENKHKTKYVWMATISTFAAKFVFAISFVLPIILFSDFTAIIIGCIWGILVLTAYSFFLAKQENAQPYKIIGEHVGIAILVIIITNFVGQWIEKIFR